MLVPKIAEYRRRRWRPQGPQKKNLPPGAALTLLEASFDENSAIIRLTFERAIDIAGLNGSVIIVDDGSITGQRYEAIGAANLETPERVAIELQPVESSEAPGTFLTAEPNTGIVAVDDGGTWPGVSDVALPYP